LYRSHYDEEEGQWTEPVNLGFPVNSAFDDYLLLPGTDLGKVMVFSGRQIYDDAVTVYRLHLSEPKLSLASATPQEIRAIANFGGRAAEVQTEFESLEQDAEITVSAKEVVAEVEKEIEPVKSSASSSNSDTNYQDLISRALFHQTASDSLTELASAARVKVRESEDPNDRWIFQKQILVWEKNAKEQQLEADQYFASVVEFNKQKTPETIEVDTVINDMTVYKYVLSDSISEKAQNVFQKKESKKEAGQQDQSSPGQKNQFEAEVATIAVANENTEFELLEESPYNEENPIPTDIEIPQTSFYRIQLGVYSKAVAFDVFGGLTPISAEIIKDRNLIKYYVGYFSSYDDAQEPLKAVRSAGYKDAFIVAWYKGSKMSLEKVRKLEK
jgi:hypothetical protein